MSRVVAVNGAPFRAANCRFCSNIGSTNSFLCAFRNCEFLADESYVRVGFRPGANASSRTACIGQTVRRSILLTTPYKRSPFKSSMAHLSADTSRSFSPSESTCPFLRVDYLIPSGCASKFPVASSIPRVCSACGRLRSFLTSEACLSLPRRRRLLQRLLAWRGDRNAFAIGSTSVYWTADSKQKPPHAGPENLGEWKQFWGTDEPDSREGKLRFRGGNLLSWNGADLDQLTPEDFRLRTDSAGYRASSDGKDLGADVDLVGPGAAYKRWQKTPEYQQWLKEAGQMKERAAAAKPETGAFVRLGGAGVAERKFDTLAKAVAGASDGDTIEIRGNGPFVSDGVTIRHPLVIRAGEGYSPSITLSGASAEKNIPLVHNSASLVLEGLEFRRIAPAVEGVKGTPKILISWGPLHVSNCRLIHNNLSKRNGDLITSMGPVLTVRNCELCSNAASAGWYPPAGGRGRIENCVSAAGRLMTLNLPRADVSDVVLRVRHNSTVGSCLILALYKGSRLTLGPPAEPQVNLDFFTNVATRLPEGRGVLCVEQIGLKTSLPAASHRNAAARDHSSARTVQRLRQRYAHVEPGRYRYCELYVIGGDPWQGPRGLEPAVEPNRHRFRGRRRSFARRRRAPAGPVRPGATHRRRLPPPPRQRRASGG